MDIIGLTRDHFSPNIHDCLVLGHGECRFNPGSRERSQESEVNPTRTFARRIIENESSSTFWPIRLPNVEPLVIVFTIRGVSDKSKR